MESWQDGIVSSALPSEKGSMACRFNVDMFYMFLLASFLVISFGGQEMVLQVYLQVFIHKSTPNPDQDALSPEVRGPSCFG